MHNIGRIGLDSILSILGRKVKYIIKSIIFLPYLTLFGYQIIIVLLNARDRKPLVLVKGNIRRLDCVCPDSNKFIYFMKEYTLLYIPENHVISPISSMAIYLIKRLISSKIVTIISDKKEDKSLWQFSLCWNNIEESMGNIERSIFTMEDISAEKSAQPLRLYFPLLKSKILPINNKFNSYPVYIGRINHGLSLENCDLTVLDKDNPCDLSPKELNLFSIRRSYSRLYFVKSMKDYYGKKFKLYGLGWENYNLKSGSFGYQKNKRHEIYSRAGICVDFLSQNGNNCLYERSIDILNSGAILVQWRSFDSHTVYGHDYANQFCFSSVDELQLIIDLIMSKGITAFEHIRQLGIENTKTFQERCNTKSIRKCIEIL